MGHYIQTHTHQFWCSCFKKTACLKYLLFPNWSNKVQIECCRVNKCVLEAGVVSIGTFEQPFRERLTEHYSPKIWESDGFQSGHVIGLAAHITWEGCAPEEEKDHSSRPSSTAQQATASTGFRRLTRGAGDRQEQPKGFSRQRAYKPATHVWSSELSERRKDNSSELYTCTAPYPIIMI